MELTKVQRLARILKVLVWITLACNVIALICVPEIVMILKDGGPSNLRRYMLGLPQFMAADRGIGTFFQLVVVFICYWAVWKSVETAVQTLFFWLCGACTAVMLCQALHILKTIRQGNPFQMANARSIKRAAVSCWVISAGSLARLIFWLWQEGSPAPLLTFTCLFIPAFFMGGLLFMVMSILFRQAAELKEDQDLTI